MASSKHIDREMTSSVIFSFFPLSESAHKHTPSFLRASLHLPFRRIFENIIAYGAISVTQSSFVSVVSFDSLPEGSDASPHRRSNYNGKLGKARPLLPNL